MTSSGSALVGINLVTAGHLADALDRAAQLAGIRGDTASGGSKPATLETGAVVQVPLFLNPGDVVKVDTRSGEYLGRVAAAG